MLKFSFNIGALTGIMLVAVKLIALVLGMDDSNVFEILGYIILVGGLVYGIRSYRDGVLGGYISYEKSLGFGTLISVGAAIIFAFFLYIYFTFIDASEIEKMIEVAKEDIYNNEGLSEEEIEMSVNAMSTFVTPGFISVSAMLAYVFVGFIFSLIVSIFMKKPEPFIEGE